MNDFKAQMAKMMKANIEKDQVNSTSQAGQKKNEGAQILPTEEKSQPVTSSNNDILMKRLHKQFPQKKNETSGSNKDNPQVHQESKKGGEIAKETLLKTEHHDNNSPEKIALTNINVIASPILNEANKCDNLNTQKQETQVGDNFSTRKQSEEIEVKKVDEQKEKSIISNCVPTIPISISIPKVPGVPAVPGVAGVPGIPKVPGVPGVPGIPKVPGVPGVPGVLKPGVPGIPTLAGKGPSLPSMQQLNAIKLAKAKVRTVQNMKPLYWVVIENKKIKGTIWEKLDDSNVSLNAIKLEDEFAVKKKEIVSVPKEEKVPAKNAKVSMLLPARQQNINIVLSKLRRPAIQIVEALIAYDESILKQNICELLIPIMPTAAEISQVNAYDGDSMNLAECDLFVICLQTAGGYLERLKSIIFKATYSEEVKTIFKSIENFSLVFEFIRSNKLFHRWVEIILAYGNYLNGVTTRGGAYGFRLDILAKVIELKSGDNKKTLLYYLVEYITEVLKEEELLNINSYLEVFDKLSLQCITDSYKDLTSRFKDVTTLYDKVKKNDIHLEDDDKSIPFLESFYDNAFRAMLMMDEKIPGIEEKFRSLVQFLGDNIKEFSMETFIETFKKFNKDLIATKASYLHNKELKEKLEKKAKLKK